jgi:toxin-antitoxin system PIN domain toxin
MTACDTNILFPALEASHVNHVAARTYLNSQADNPVFVICELTLLEVYLLVRNPKVSRKPLDAPKAVAIIQTLRSNPHWRLVDYPGTIMNDVWRVAARPGIAIRRIVDTRLALTLRHHGVTHFATANEKDFAGFGFERVWNPLKSA